MKNQHLFHYKHAQTVNKQLQRHSMSLDPFPTGVGYTCLAIMLLLTVWGTGLWFPTRNANMNIKMSGHSDFMLELTGMLETSYSP